MVVREEQIKIPGGTIPITLIRDVDEEGEFFTIEIDGVEWCGSPNKIHAIVLFEMMKDHITEYMNYKKT